MKNTIDKARIPILEVAYEAPSAAVTGVHMISVLCISGSTEELIDEGDVDWFSTTSTN